ncbi:FAD-binding dehydrogenase [Pengzhenrongella sicca]|uniref:FAD-binding dehydrogenase n=1 Tax=Pengzhenrongella sicca TaxID=2819238 RepID=A0A8A4ZBD1_9MICO|nr:FAD-binding dehydrogenase [Pengzhenrongella sicca]QTE28725.1 FAD-binding dehydrogenase [Pengzhenrongella sicca]
MPAPELPATTDVVVIGAGLAGLVATAELTRAGHRVVLLEQEPAASLGGQAWWSFGGLFLVDSPEQRRLGIRDSADLALADWLGSADFAADGADANPRAWAEGFVDFAAGELRPWLHGLGVRWFPAVQWAERGGYLADGHGNSVPRFHVTWGTGPAILTPFVESLRQAWRDGLVEVRFRHRVTALTTTDGRVTGVAGEVLAADAGLGRGQRSSREAVGGFEVTASAVVVAAGGIGANHDLVRATWPAEFGALPARMLSGVPDHVDGAMITAAAAAGGQVLNAGRMWHYPEGIANHDPVWTAHGIRLLPGPTSLWLDADGHRLPAPLFPGFDSLGALRHLTSRGHDHSWFVLNKAIMGTEFALSGSEQNPDLTGKDVRAVLQRALPGAVGPVERFAELSSEFVWANTPADLAAGMNALTDSDGHSDERDGHSDERNERSDERNGHSGRIDGAELARTIAARDRQVATGLGKDLQVTATAMARRYVVDRLIRVAPPAAMLDPKDGPLLAVRLSVLTRKTLGGLHTNPTGQVLRPDGSPLAGVWAAGEAAGFGGGGMHGHRALEGTFLGGCLFSGRVAGRAVAAALRA